MAYWFEPIAEAFIDWNSLPLYEMEVQPAGGDSSLATIQSLKLIWKGR